MLRLNTGSINWKLFPRTEENGLLKESFPLAKNQTKTLATCKQQDLKNAVSKVSDLPKGWARTQIGEIACLVRGVNYKKQEASGVTKEGYLPILRANNINAKINFDELVYVPAERISPEQLVESLDIVFAMSSGSKDLVGKAAQSVSGFGGGFGAFCGLVRPSGLLNGKLIGYFFQSPNYRRTISLLSSGVNINNLRREHIETMPIHLAPLNEQRRIVAKIEELFTRLDAGIEALKKVKTELKRYRQAVLRAAFEGKLTADWRKKNKDKIEPASKLLERIAKEREKSAKGKIKKLPPLDTSERTEPPTGWEWTRICEVSADNQIGLVKSHVQQNKEGRGVGYIKMNNVTMDGKVVFDDLVYVEADASEIARFALREEDILFNTRNSVELVGKTGLVRNIKGPLIYNNNLMRIRTMGGIVPSFMACQMCSTDFRGRMEKVKRATTNVAALYAKDVLPLPLILPSEREQQQIVAEIDRHFSIADEVEQTIEKCLKEADRLRQSILKKAFEGKLVPQDPNDVPAEKLLERIKTERARQ